MFSDDLSKVHRVEVAINVLTQALYKLHEHDYTSAQVMVALVRQMLEELQMDFDLQFQAENMLQQLLHSSE